jgi:nucleotide-binding universal stress UspA family protein
MKILLAIDGSRFSDAAVEAVVALSNAQTAEIHVLHVVEPPSLLVTREMSGADRALDLAWEVELKQAKDLVESTAQQLTSKGLNATGVLERGDAKSKILEAARDWGADLIVIGSHGRKGLEHFLMGSVSEAVARHARCSVEIVRIAPSQ